MVEFRRLGMHGLMNTHRVIEHDGAQLVIAGVTDYSAHFFDPDQRSDPKRALAGSPDGVPKILLAHQPRSAAAAAEAGFDLQLSGHTHGGQFWPWNHLVRLQPAEAVRRPSGNHAPAPGSRLLEFAPFAAIPR